MKSYKICIIGGGPSGMMAGISSAENLEEPEKIAIIDKNNDLGQKLLLTGGGRCNITNEKPIKNQLKLYPEKNFLKPSFFAFDNNDLLKMFESKGVEFKVEDNGRIFPTTDDAHIIKGVLKDYLTNLNVDIISNTTVKSVKHELNNDKKLKFNLKTDNDSIECDKLIITTGGISYPNTGSDGDGYMFAESLSHTITPIKPGLVSLKVEDSYLHKLAGIQLNNVKVSFKDRKKKISTTGDVLISHTGVTGPAIIDLSNDIMRKSDYNLLNNETKLNNMKISIDLKPELNEDQLKERITNDIPSNGTTKIKNYMKYYMSNNFIEYFLNKAQVSSNKTMSSLTRKDKNRIVDNLKHLSFEISDIVSEDAKVTIGGVNIKEIESKTLESNLVEGLYFAGEVLEPAGPTGGYNLQLCFSTGYLAGLSASKSLK